MLRTLLRFTVYALALWGVINLISSLGKTLHRKEFDTMSADLDAEATADQTKDNDHQ